MHLDGGFLEEPDRGEVFLVLAAQRCRGLQSVKSGLSRLIAGESFLHSDAELGSTEILRLIQDLPEAHPHRASLDSAVDRPEIADVLLFGRVRDGRRGSAVRWAVVGEGPHARFADHRKGYKADETCESGVRRSAVWAPAAGFPRAVHGRHLPWA
jgi:hypothetical protein